MVKGRISVLDTGYDSVECEEKLFSDADSKLEIFPGGRHDRSGKILFAQDAKGIFIRWTEIEDDFLEGTKELKAIVRYGVGYDNVNLDSANRFNVNAANVQGYANHAVSDHAISMMYACVRVLPLGQASLKTNYGAPPIQEIFEFHNNTVGIIGLGRIGGTFCQKTKALFQNVLASDPYITDERFNSLGAEKTNLETLLVRCVNFRPWAES